MEMASVRNVFTPVSHFLLTLMMISLATAEIKYPVCINNGNYTNGSAYQTNLNNLLSSLPSVVDPFGFTNSTAGSDSEQAYALVLCRGDVDHDSCRKCVNDTVSKLSAACPGYKEASGFYEYCMLRYSNRSLTGSVSTSNTFYLWNPYNSTNATQFNQDLTTLMIDLRTKAAKGGSRLKFAAANKTIPDFQTIFALAQCTPDLTEEQCNNCLLDAIAQIPNCCDGKKGGRVITWSCNFRFETYLFYNQTGVQALSPPPPPLAGFPPPSPAESPPPSTGNSNGDSNHTVTIVAISISSVVGFLLIFTLCFIIISTSSNKHKKKKNPIIPAKSIERLDSSMNDISSTEIVQYDFETIKEATNDFSDDNRLGQGGFGVVYRGEFSTGQEIAVKRLSREHGQGDQEFKNEVMLVAKLQHRNLVRILGFCIDGTERLLVYEFLANSSLDHFLFDHVKRTQLDWQSRFKIIGGIARGLLYLHEDSRVRIIHRDMKASNILLDGEMNPKISDFGMARLSAMDETQGNTSKVVGTYGYMAPEYIMYGQFSVKSDVFSFGMLVLEIISGQKNNNSFNNGGDILSFAWKCWKEGGRGSKMIDPMMLRDAGGSVGEMIRCIHIGLLCTQDNASDRPTMASVVLMFNSFSVTLPVPLEPAFCLSTRTRANNTNMLPLRDHGVSEESDSSGLIRSIGRNNNNSQHYSNGNDSFTELYPR